MTTATPDTTTDLELITESWEAPHCESAHAHRLNQECTHIPVARQSARCGANDGMKVCLGHVKWHMQVRERFTKHSQCGTKWSECLDIIPL